MLFLFQNLTEFNTAHNRRISMLGISDDTEKRNANRKRKRRGVSFNEDEEIINPEDIDPSIGRFRNLIQTTVIPTTQKRQKLTEAIGIPSTSDFKMPKPLLPSAPQLYEDLPPETNNGSNIGLFSSLSSKLGIVLPNPAPDVEIGPNYATQQQFIPPQVQSTDPMEPKKKKYAKEAWPGKKPAPTLLV